MLRRRPKLLICTTLTTVATVAAQRYFAPNGTRTTISSATVCNRSASAQLLSISIVPLDSPMVPLLFARSIPAGVTLSLPALVGHTIEPGGELYANANVNALVDLTVSGYEESEA